MDYRLELLGDSTFEDLINTICHKILGTGVISFSDLSPKDQAEMLVQKAEFPRNIFSENEKAFVNEYAETFPGQVERLNDLVWDMRESYDEAGSKLVYEVIQEGSGESPKGPQTT